MKYIRTFEENKPKENGDKYTKMRYCYKCEQFAKHLDGKCLNCKKIKQQEKDRQKNWGVK